MAFTAVLKVELVWVNRVNRAVNIRMLSRIKT